MLGGRIGRMWKVGRIGLVPPRPMPGRAGLAIALVVRDEARHIGEWAEFHRAAGVARVIAYDDRCTDATIPILREVLGDRLAIVPWAQRLALPASRRAIHNQALAYAHAAANFGADLRWMAFIDADEFLVPKRAPTLDAALAHLEGCRNLSLPWHMFGRNGHDTPPAGGVVANYLRRAADPMSERRGVRAFKCIVDPCHLTAAGVHAMETDGGTATFNDRGEMASLRARARPGFYSADHVQLNHYYARSEAELAAKISRGPNLLAKAGAYERKVRRTVEAIEADEVEDRAALDFLARRGLA